MTVAPSMPGLRTLPAPVIDPDDVQAVVPSLTPDEAQLYASLATLSLAAALWPNAIPPEPLPAPIEAAGLSIATRLATAGEAAGDDAAGPVVSESIGGYTYRLATPAALDTAMQLTDAERTLLRPWLGQDGAYDIGVGWPGPAWPADWWQRDLDRIEPGAVPDTTQYLTEAMADARYSQVTHGHDEVRSSPWNFATGTTAGDPGQGKVRLNNAAPAAATEIFIDPIDQGGVDQSAFVASLRAGDIVRLQDKDDATRWERYALTAAPIAEAGWHRLPVTHTLSSPVALAPTNNQPLVIYIARAGHNP